MSVLHGTIIYWSITCNKNLDANSLFYYGLISNNHMKSTVKRKQVFIKDALTYLRY